MTVQIRPEVGRDDFGFWVTVTLSRDGATWTSEPARLRATDQEAALAEADGLVATLMDMLDIKRLTAADVHWILEGRVTGKRLSEPTGGDDKVSVTDGTREATLEYRADVDAIFVSGQQIKGVCPDTEEFYEYLGVLSQVLREGHSEPGKRAQMDGGG